MDELEERLGYTFHDPELLRLALTHSSFAYEKGRGRLGCNERLEFLGDSLLGFFVAEYLYRSMADRPEGDMTRIRSDLVCEKSLVEVAQRLHLGEELRLGRGEQVAGGRTRVSMQADAVEAILAAIYLDGGMAEARAFVDRILLDRVRHGGAVNRNDYKTELQELVQRHGGAAPVYRLVGENAATGDPVFMIKKSDRALYFANAAIAAGVFAMLLPVVKTAYSYMSVEASVPGAAILMTVTVPDIFDLEGFFGMFAWLALAVVIGLAARFSASKRHVNNRNVTVVLALASMAFLWLYSHSAEEYYEEFGNETSPAWGFWAAMLLMAAGVGLTVYASTKGMDAPAYPVSGSGYGGYGAGQYGYSGAQNVYPGTQNAAQAPRESVNTASAVPTRTGYVQVPPPVAPVNPAPRPESAGGEQAVKFCTSCGAKIPAGAKFCSRCGAPQG